MKALPEAWTIRTIRQDDVGPLLTFEEENRAWFELHLNLRDPGFYSDDGVRAHIGQLVQEYADGIYHASVILDDQGAIVGRVNLKSIDKATGSAEVGYRIAQQHTGKGVATAALGYLIALARGRWGLGQLIAYVRAENLASASVLGRHGFLLDESGVGAGRAEGCKVFSLQLE